MERQCRLSHRRPSGQHQQLPFEKAAQPAVELVDTRRHLQFFAGGTRFLFTVDLFQHPAAHLSGPAGGTAHGKEILQLLHPFVDAAQECHHVDGRVVRLQGMLLHVRTKAAQHPATDH